MTDVPSAAGRFTDALRAEADPLWEAQHRHPFVRGVADGSLSLDRFVHWLRQDHAFLVDYCRVLALGAARAEDVDTIGVFADLLRATVRDEMALHRRLADDLGIGAAGLGDVGVATAVRAYTDFLLRTAALGDVAALLGALLPCMWGFSEIGQRLATGPLPDEQHLRAWVESYADEAFAEQARWCRSLVDRHAERHGPAGRAAIREAFLLSSRHELAFWDMAWNLAG